MSGTARYDKGHKSFDGVVHIERLGNNYDNTVTHVQMRCGASCLLVGIALPMPPLDWYHPSSNHIETDPAICPKCLAAKRLSSFGKAYAHA